MRVTGLDHVQIAIPEGGEGPARAFYAGLLGLAEVEKPAELRARGGLWLDGPGFQLHLGVEAAFAPARKAHPAFLVEDLAEARRKLAEAGAPTEEDSTVPGVRRCYAADPFGNRVELIQAGDGFRR